MPLPRISRIDFYRRHEDDLALALAGAFAAHAEREPDPALLPDQRAVIAWARMQREVANGGFTQFFYNQRGEGDVEPLANLFVALNLPKAAVVVREAAALYRSHESAFAVDDPWNGLFGSVPEFDKLDRALMNLALRANRAMEKWIRANIAELAVDESGEPIDPQFTGAVEVLQSNGLVAEYLEVRKGKPHGAYREFFDDGTVRKVVFYKSGKTTGDFWPDGTLKRKVSKRGGLTVVEWFHPNGRLQKRYAHDKSGYAVEPILRYHDNGRLAEKLTVEKDEKRGPWLKFFDDGSPQLVAEHADDEKLIVHDAWDENREQRVRDGEGVFYDDGRSIDWKYDVDFEGGWQHETELKNGVPQGRKTTYHEGLLWSVGNIRSENGVEHSEQTTYWDNGRVRSVARSIGGEEVESESFPKFDRPIPAVLLRVDADEKLYKAWKHAPVDEYPRVLNLDEVRARLTIPDFLREVHERNLAGAVALEDYEDWSRFDDGIAYFLTVTEAGEVAGATANGSGVYSGGVWDDYPPFLRQLRFTPGRIRGRAVECRVLARVDHTFVEGKAE